MQVRIKEVLLKIRFHVRKWSPIELSLKERNLRELFSMIHSSLLSSTHARVLKVQNFISHSKTYFTILRDYFSRGDVSCWKIKTLSEENRLDFCPYLLDSLFATRAISIIGNWQDILYEILEHSLLSNLGRLFGTRIQWSMTDHIIMTNLGD